MNENDDIPFGTLIGGASKVEIREVSKIFADTASAVTALDNISLTVNSGEFFCLLGDSGCGKSTLLELVAGFEQPTSGSVLVDGVEIREPSHRRGVVFQGSSLLPWLNARDNISVGLKLRGAGGSDSPAVSELIQLMGLTGFEWHKPSQLSGGMAQRVSIARALVNEPDLLLFDEPFSALDSFTRKRLQSELVRIWMRNRFTAIFVTHDIAEAVTLATRVALMTPRPGRIEAVFQVPLPYPRDSTSTEFFRISSMITREFLSLDRDVTTEVKHER
ncbi:MAG TPA: ABC transporter ATP-binding protein [Gemmatimonadaceae bacterium]|nr:ABC transporter ATP-binding protein [Gemmatimonadaceae bacterium]